MHNVRRAGFAIALVLLVSSFVCWRLFLCNDGLNPQVIANSDYEDQAQIPVIQLLGMSFVQVEDRLGTPDHRGYSVDYGPHNYLQYDYQSGMVRFCSPERLTAATTVSIIVSGQVKVLDTKVGMTFSEIEAVLGPGDYGPAFGLDDSYYLVYWMEADSATPHAFTITFSAESLDGATYEAFIKLESFEDPVPTGHCDSFIFTEI